MAVAEFPVTVEADNGPVTIEERPEAIISLSSVATEILFEIGAGPQVIAVDDQSNYPEGAPMTAIEVLEIIDELRASEPLTVVTAVHDFTLDGKFADRLVLLSGGSVVSDGAPGQILTEENLASHYGARVRIVHDEEGPAVIPSRRQR